MNIYLRLISYCKKFAAKISNREVLYIRSSASTNKLKGIVIVMQSSKFQVLDYEMSLPIAFKSKRLEFDLTPTYTVPVNQATLLVNNQQVVQEKLSNLFYTEVEIKFNF